MVRYLEKDAGKTVLVGPFTAIADAIAPVTSMTEGDISCDLFKDVARTALTLTSTGGGVNDIVLVANSDGYWTLELTNGNVDTVGELTISFSLPAVFLPFKEVFEVVSKNVFDSRQGTDYLHVNVAEISEDATAANNLELDYDGTGLARANSTIGTCTTNTDMAASKASQVLVATTIHSDGRSTTTARLVAGGSTQDDAYIGMMVILDSKPDDGFWVSRTIIDYDGGDKEITFSPAIDEDADDGGAIYVIPGDTVNKVTLATILTDTNEIQGKLPTNNIMGSSDTDNHDTDIDAILVDTNEIQGKLPTNKIMGSSDVDNHDTDIDAILVDTNEIQGKLPTNKIMGSSDVDNHDTDIDAILVDTNEMQGKLPTNEIMGSSDKADNDTVIDAIKTQTDKYPEGFKKATQFDDFQFTMVDETDGYTLETGKTITEEISKDGASYENLDNAASEVDATGTYKITLSATDLNCDAGMLRFSSAGCRTKHIFFKTET